MINRYKDISNWIDLNVIYNWTGEHNYFSDLFAYRRNPLNSVNSYNCYLGVKEVLDYDWKRPTTVIQRAVRGGTSSSLSSRRESHILPPWLSRIAPHRLSPMNSSAGTGGSVSRLRTSGWALSATAAESNLQFKLLHCTDKMSFFAEFVKALKRGNIEAYLSLDGSNNITFLGKVLCEYSDKPPHWPSSRILSESLCVSGTTVYPVVFQPAASVDNLLTMKQFQSLLHVACVLYDAEFTIVREGSNFTLYGPDSCKASFVSPTPVISSTSGPVRFHFEVDASYDTRTSGRDCILAYPPNNILNDADFRKDYDFNKAPFTIRITFEDSKGNRITSEAKIYKGAKPRYEHMRFYIDNKTMVEWYKATYGTMDKRFSFEETYFGDGTKPEWIAREL